VQSGQLTAGETAKLESKESALNREERNIRKLDYGKLTARDKRTLNQQQSKLSRQIYHKKHNGHTQPGAHKGPPGPQSREPSAGQSSAGPAEGIVSGMRLRLTGEGRARDAARSQPSGPEIGTCCHRRVPRSLPMRRAPPGP
jgi:hypothetical protein